MSIRMFFLAARYSVFILFIFKHTNLGGRRHGGGGEEASLGEGGNSGRRVFGCTGSLWPERYTGVGIGVK